MIQINPNRKIENDFPDSSVKTATDKFDTLDGGLVNSLTVGFTPIQDLHGYSKPWVGGAGRNKLNSTLVTASTKNGITCSPQFDDDGNLIGYQLSGTATTNADFQLRNAYGSTDVYIPSGTYRANNTGAINGVEFHNGYSTDSYPVAFGNTDTEIVCSNGISWTVLRVKSGTVIDEPILVQPMIRLASIADPTFEPYANICPISGHTQVQSKINNTTNTTYLGDTYYGGDVEQVGGTGEETKYNLTMSSKTWLASGSPNRYYIDITDGTPNQPYHYTNTEVADALCSMYKVYSRQELENHSYGISLHYSVDRVYINVKDVDCADATAFNSKISGQDLCYKLATPTTLSLTGQNITAEVGTNNVSAPLTNQEIVEDGVTYKEMFSWSDVVAYVQSQVNP